MTVKSRHSFEPYRVDPDPAVDWVIQARCVFKGETDCKATSPEMSDQQKVTKWIAQHRAEAGHARFEETYRRAVIATIDLRAGRRPRP
ncbi:hypothetical protein [Streptomyces sp. C]|uniref:DUF7848 domain-containing protein n=1 Tax=Streptomyces sp. C TaxID=253839 RepID=UPI0001B536AB|nr:hypothetical protein [Streptomyces sp. C]EFL15291.1 predicted protein [Streptomyces sp. C]